MRILGWTVGLAIAALVGGGIYAYLNGQTLIRDAVTQYGPQVTGTPVSLRSVSLAPSFGKASVHGLEIGTPPGFGAPFTLRLDKADLTLVPRSLFKDTLHIRKLELVAPIIVYEPGRRGSNLDVLQRNINAFSTRVAAQFGDAEEARGKSLIIDALVIRQPQLRIMATQAGLGEHALTLADITLRDIGVAEGGIAPGQAARLAMDALMPQVMAALASRQGRRLLDQALRGRVELDGSLVEQGKKALGSKLKDRLKNITGEKN
ncbi:MAG: hypothetical protein ACOY99_11210 [Pseudomonadota bacterium]